MADMVKKTYLGLGPKKFIMAITMSLAVFICGLLSKQEFYEIAVSALAVVTIIFLSEGKTIGCILGTVYSVAYAAVCFSRQLYGLAFFMAFLVLPLYVISLFTWKKNQNKGAVEIKRLSAAKLILVIAASVAGYCCIFFVLGKVGSSNAPLDSLTIVFGMAGMVLLSLRYLEQWYFNIASNAAAVVIWAVKSFESASNLNFLIAAAVFVASNVIGLVSWFRLNKKTGDQKND